MTTKQTAAEKRHDLELAQSILSNYRAEIESGNALLLISQEFGKGLTDYLRLTLTFTAQDGRTQSVNLTWSIGKLAGYPIRSRSGYIFLAVGGYGYSKADEMARNVAFYLGLASDAVRYEIA